MTTRTKPAQFVVVTTEHRGVFGGHVEARDDAAKTITLTDAQMCVYWTADVRGILGLAATGPKKGCRVTPSIPRIALNAVTSVMDASPEAVEAWRSRPWA